jgi:partner of Y14 and mago
MPPKSQPPTSSSGIRQLSNGDSVIPSSTRADGSVRKEIKVKPGYKPPEDVEVYKNRAAEAWKNRGKGGVPGAQTEDGASKDGNISASAAKNAKRKEARKKAAAAAGEKEGTPVNGDAVQAEGEVIEETIDPKMEKAKEARKLAKKLRQARELQEKKEKGGDLLPEQFAKVIKINELIRQLDSLGFDADGERKGQEKDEP